MSNSIYNNRYTIVNKNDVNFCIDELEDRIALRLRVKITNEPAHKFLVTLYRYGIEGYFDVDVLLQEYSEYRDKYDAIQYKHKCINSIIKIKDNKILLDNNNEVLKKYIKPEFKELLLYEIVEDDENVKLVGNRLYIVDNGNAIKDNKYIYEFTYSLTESIKKLVNKIIHV
jgi:hypothetical protein